MVWYCKALCNVMFYNKSVQAVGQIYLFVTCVCMKGDHWMDRLHEGRHLYKITIKSYAAKRQCTLPRGFSHMSRRL
jgi:hypothetical protein